MTPRREYQPAPEPTRVHLRALVADASRELGVPIDMTTAATWVRERRLRPSAANRYGQHVFDRDAGIAAIRELLKAGRT